MEDSDKCSLCLRNPKVRPVVANCSHTMCGGCAGEHCFKSRRAGDVTCPLCRARITKFMSVSASSTDNKSFAKFQYAGISWEIDVLRNEETVENRITKLLNIPSRRIRIFGKGGKLVENFNDLLDNETKFRLIGTPVDESFGKDSYLYIKLKNWFRYYFFLCQDYCVWFLQFAVIILQCVFLFFRTMSPSSNLKAEELELIRERERERHRAMNH
mmetsp:Transcript_17380/g.21387  ORF Transcript_17380/g.21387 Transcript_17380/m.21387 type:complete len:214 (-) Transcript_17380:114-755(-)